MPGKVFSRQVPPSRSAFSYTVTSVKPASRSLMALSTPAIPAPITTKRMSPFAGSEPVKGQRDNEIGNLGCTDAVVGGQAPVCKVADQHRQSVGHHPRRGDHHFAVLLGSDDAGFDIVDEALIDAAELRVETVVHRVGVAEEKLGGGFLGFEELACPLDRGGARH